MKTINLKTPYYDNCNFNLPWNEYPRPQLLRNSYFSLNGFWQYSISKSDCIDNVLYQGTICVPFCVESILSNVNKKLKNNDYLIYHKSFSLPKGFKKDKVILHFEAVSQSCKVYFNNHLVCTHDGAYLPFEADVTDYLKTINELIVVCKNPISIIYPYGKQSRHPANAFYTPCSGIWQTVWLESVPKDYIKSVKINADYDTKTVEINIDSTCDTFQIKISHDSCLDFDFNETINTNKIKLSFDEIVCWDVDNPKHYYIEIIANNDRIFSYFAFRKVSIQNYKGYPRIFLNDKPIFNNGVLDQGYYSDGLYTPATIKGYKNDINIIKSLGFNTIRKHIKIEPRIFYFLCDREGILVWQDMVNNNTISFNVDENQDRNNHKSPKARKVFIEHTKQTIDLLNCFPSIILWTIFNEGWGQFNSKELYQMVKEYDPTRLVDTTSGWYDYGYSDVNSLHIYGKDLELTKDKRATTLSEFGGYVYQVKNHVYSPNKEYGYRFFETKESYQKAFVDLYEKQIIPLIDKGLCACIYTQLSDIEEEINGLLTYDRKILKIDGDVIKQVMDKIHY